MKAFRSLQMNAFFSFLVIGLFSMSVSAEAQYSQLSVKIERYTSSKGEIDINKYIKNVGHYAGYRLVAVDVIAGALVESATMTVHINNTRQGQTLKLGQTTLSHRIVPNTGFFMGRGAEKIKLRTVSPAYVKYVNLILAKPAFTSGLLIPKSEE